MENNYLERIKKAKNDQKMTNETLSEKTGIPLSTLSKTLAGFSDSPKFVNVIAIAEALKIPFSYLINGDETDNTFCLDEKEEDLISSYRQLDGYGKNLVEAVLNMELGRVTAADAKSEVASKPADKGTVLPPIHTEATAVLGKRKIPYYADLKASAGTGQYLDGTSTIEEIWIPDIDKTRDADFVVMISGNSMEPKFHNGDYIMVQSCESVEPGELGLFVADGESYFKVYEGDHFKSLNPDYQPIWLNQFESVRCFGRVIGKLKKK